MVATAVTVGFEPGSAQEVPDDAASAPLWERDTLTDGWFGLGGWIEEHGLSLGFGLTQVYQASPAGGAVASDGADDLAGSYDLELGLDTGALLGLAGGQVYALVEGGWSEGLDPRSVGSLFGINTDALGDHRGQLAEVWYEQALLDDRVRLRLGRLDLTTGFECRGFPAAFDGSAFANDETSQFLNGGLVNNPAIPFPDRGPGVALHLQPASWWYATAGLARVEVDDDRHEPFGILETGVAPVLTTTGCRRPGAYRVGVWYDPQPKPLLAGHESGSDLGLYLAFDQMVLPEVEAQGLGLFGRIGLADGDAYPIHGFWSLGAQWQGMIPGRDEDVLALGLAHGRLSRAAGFQAPHESVVEFHGRIQLSPWLSLTPSFQYVLNPGGANDAQAPLVGGLRIQVAF
jgi:porin